MKKSKAQVSTEYLIVFGIAFLIIAAGTFAFMKFSKSGMWTKSQCIISEPELDCEGFVKTYDSCTDNECLLLYLKNNLKDEMTIKSIEFEGYSGTSGGDITLSPGGELEVKITNGDSFRPGAKINTDFILEYIIVDSIVPHYVTGYISGRMLPKPGSSGGSAPVGGSGTGFSCPACAVTSFSDSNYIGGFTIACCNSVPGCSWTGGAFDGLCAGDATGCANTQYSGLSPTMSSSIKNKARNLACSLPCVFIDGGDDSASGDTCAVP